MTRLRASILIGMLVCATAGTADAQKASPVKALTARAANPRGPFAKLNTTQRDSIIENASQLLGVKYKWGGTTPEKGIDCSGFVKYLFAKLGVELPHRAAELAKLGGSINKDTADMQPGDLLVFGKGKRISHVGMYVGDGKMIHASSSNKRVVETTVMRFRAPGGLQWKGVRRVIALDSTSVASRRPGFEP